MDQLNFNVGKYQIAEATIAMKDVRVGFTNGAFAKADTVLPLVSVRS